MTTRSTPLGSLDDISASIHDIRVGVMVYVLLFLAYAVNAPGGLLAFRDGWRS